MSQVCWECTVTSTLTPGHGSFSSGESGGLCGQSVVHSVGKGSPGVQCAPLRDGVHPCECKNGDRIVHMSTFSLSQAHWCCPLMREACHYGHSGSPKGKGTPLGRTVLLQHCGKPPSGVCNPAECCTASHNPGIGRAACWLGGSHAAGLSDGPAG